MKLNLNLKKKIQRFCLLLICLVVLIFQSDIPNLNALTMDDFQSEMVIEELRLKVPADVKAAWLNAEKEIWEPWLSSQDGFLGRQLFWDKEKEEALILVNWKSKKLWKSIERLEETGEGFILVLNAADIPLGTIDRSKIGNFVLNKLGFNFPSEIVNKLNFKNHYPLGIELPRIINSMKQKGDL